MKKIYLTIILNIVLFLSVSAQEILLQTGFEGPGFDEGWTIGVSQDIAEDPQDYPATGLDPWEKWDITETTAFGYVHSGDSAAWIGGTMYAEPTHDWLMTPEFYIPENGSTKLSYWLWYHSEQTYVNKFYIMIYDMDNPSWEEAYLLANDFNSPYHYTEEYYLDLTPWNGKNIKIAFVKNGTYQMAMDDILVTFYENNSIFEHESNSLLVYPNPANDILNISVETIPQDNILTFSDITGKTVMKTIVDNNDININISELKTGIYFVVLGNYRSKIVVY